METRTISKTQKFVLGALLGATIGFALYLWVSPLIGGQCLVICDPYRAVLAGAFFGALMAWARTRGAEQRKRRAQEPDGGRGHFRRKQKRALWIGAVFIAMMTIYPPWTITRLAEDGTTRLTHASHYRFLWRPPSIKKGLEAASVDAERLAIQWALVAVITGVAVAATRIDEKEVGQT